MAAPFPSLDSPLPPHHSQRMFLPCISWAFEKSLPFAFTLSSFSLRKRSVLPSSYFLSVPVPWSPHSHCSGVFCEVIYSLSLLYLQPLLCLFTLPLPFFWHKVQITPILLRKKKMVRVKASLASVVATLPSQLSWKTVTLLFVITSSMCVYSSVCGVWLPPTIPDHCTGAALVRPPVCPLTSVPFAG